MRNALQLDLQSAASPTDDRLQGLRSDQLHWDIATRKREDILSDFENHHSFTFSSQAS
ncbi:hypothetical protein T440DRAFT_468479 [Plenodomus tracheiphilus IPT5]|uniref:Uncharacterized protein n=1 Tax=Plenodomus tracheiphilus IPT5 TaxID=1408161 RepID=A0A6A7B4P3_9PLEO|nr:hypothetical protein T440DRAFT_468479 [Plenodomus tracheiphilus IPT5]